MHDGQLTDDPVGLGVDFGATVRGWAQQFTKTSLPYCTICSVEPDSAVMSGHSIYPVIS